MQPQILVVYVIVALAVGNLARMVIGTLGAGRQGRRSGCSSCPKCGPKPERARPTALFERGR